MSELVRERGIILMGN